VELISFAAYLAKPHRQQCAGAVMSTKYWTFNHMMWLAECSVFLLTPPEVLTWGSVWKHSSGDLRRPSEPPYTDNGPQSSGNEYSRPLGWSSPAHVEFSSCCRDFRAELCRLWWRCSRSPWLRIPDIEAASSLAQAGTETEKHDKEDGVPM